MKKLKPSPGACVFHDRVNLIALPILGLISLAGLLGWYEAEKVSGDN